MEKLSIKYQNLLKIYNKLERIKDKFLNPPVYADEEDIEAYMTTLIKRFELTFEMLWKFYKLFLSDYCGEKDLKGSKDVFRRCFELNIFDESEVEALLTSIEDRNVTTHEYNFVKSQELCKKFVNYYYPIFASIIEKTAIIYASANKSEFAQKDEVSSPTFLREVNLEHSEDSRT